MSDQTSTQSKVASKMQKLAEALEVNIEDVEVTIEDGGLGETVISGADVAEYLTEGESTEGDDQSTTETTEGDDESDDQSTTGHLKSDGTKCQISEAVEDCHVHSESTDSEDQSTTESEDEPEHPEDADNPSQENYVFHFGTCSEEDCSYGANGEEAEYCASHQSSTDDSDSSTPSKKKDYEDLTEGEQKLVKDLISDEDYDLSEAVEMV